MQKKIMAAAVAGALALPVTALAQTSTVNIYGRITYEHGFADAGRGRPDTDINDSPGGSAIGFRGEEKLGGGLSAWFQCESSADVRAFDQTGFCTRNSAVGFKGGFGNVFFGRWDTPLKRAMNVGTVGAEETGILGMSFLPFGGSGGAAAYAGNGNEGASGETIQRQRFKRREAGLIYYETPNFGGFTGMAALSSGNSAADNAYVSGMTNDKSRIVSLGGTYTAGPLGIGAGYEKHLEFGVPCVGVVGGVGGTSFFGSPVLTAPVGGGVVTSAQPACPAAGLGNFDDRGWGVSAAYTWGPVKVGGTWLERKFETAIGRSLKSRTWTVGVDWAIAGPHSVQAQYAMAGDSKGNSLTSIGGNGGVAAPLTAAGVARSDTGANALSLSYQYAFSKRTIVKFGYVRVDNDTNANIVRIGNTASLIAGTDPGAVATGQSVDGYAVLIGHRF